MRSMKSSNSKCYLQVDFMLSWHHFWVILRQEDSSTAGYVLKCNSLPLLETNISIVLTVYFNVLKT
jgi:hypothetical protein